MTRHIALILFFIPFASVFCIKAQISDQCLKLLSPKELNNPDSAEYLLLDRGMEYINSDSIDKAGILLGCCQEAVVNSHDTVLSMKTFAFQAKYYYNTLLYREALESYKKTLKLSEYLKDTNLMITAIYGLRNIYTELEITDSAVYYCVMELTLHKKRNAYMQVSGCYGELFSLQRYSMGGVTEKTFLLEGLLDSSLMAAYKSKNSYSITFALINNGMIVYERDPEKGLTFTLAGLDTARSIAEQPNDALVYALVKASNMFVKAGQQEQAEKNLYEAIPYAIRLKNFRQLTHLYLILGGILDSKGKYSEAVSLHTKAIKLAKEFKSEHYLPFIYSSLQTLYENGGMIDSCYYYSQLYQEVTYKKRNLELNKQIALIGAKYQINEKKERINTLSLINEQKDMQIAEHRRYIATLVISISVVLVLLIFLFLQFRKIRNAYNILFQKNEEVLRKEKELIELRNQRRMDIENKMDETRLKLEFLFEKEKIYLNKDLNLNMLASELKTNTSYLSSLINSSCNCNINQLINKYRVMEACDILKSRNGEMYSLEGIADMTGFKSKSVFNKVFKEKTGLTPSVFRNMSILKN